jgi:hypothetical protein
LQDDTGSAKDQPHAAEHPSSLGEDPSGHETKFTENPSGHNTVFTEDPPQVPQKRWTRKSHYVAPPPVPTNPKSQLIIKPVGES